MNMKTISRYILILLAPLFFTVLHAQDGDAVFNKVIHEYTLHSDGSYDYRDYKEVKLLSHMSFHRLFGETFIIFDPAYQEIVINEAYTIMRDGKKVVVPDNAFNEVLPRAAAYAAPYNRLRELVITHTGLEVGATVYLDYTLKTKAGYMPVFMGEELISDIVPVMDKQVVIRVPEGEELHYKMLNLRTSPEIGSEGQHQVYRFVFRGLKANPEAWGTDPLLLPRLFFSTAKDLERAYFPFVAQEAFTFRADPAMEAIVKKVQEENQDDLSVALALQKVVVDELNTWNLALEYTGFKCRPPAEVLRSNGGTKLEKSILLATLLQQARLSGVPVAVIPDQFYDRTVGSLYMFRDFAVMAKVGMGERMYFSPVRSQDQNLSYSLQGNKMLILDGAIESLRTFDPEVEPAGMNYQGSFTIDESGHMTGKMTVNLMNAANPYFRLFSDTAYAKRYAGGVKEVELLKNVQGESTFELGIDMEKAWEHFGDYYFMDIPSSRYGIDSWGFTYVEAGRQAPIRLREVVSEEYNYVLTLPEGFTLVSPAVDMVADNPVGKIVISIRQEGNSIYATRTIWLKKEVILYTEFEAFNELWASWINPSMRKIIMKKDEARD